MGEALVFGNQGRVRIQSEWREVIKHPEIGWVLDEQGGAAGNPGDNAYSRAQGPAPEWITNLIERQPDLLDRTLASDGWWYRVTRPCQYGLPTTERKR